MLGFFIAARRIFTFLLERVLYTFVKSCTTLSKKFNAGAKKYSF
jgi:hypothetical protein